MSGTQGEAFELDTTFEPRTAKRITFNIRGMPVAYDNAAQQVICNGITQHLASVGGMVHLRIFSDRGIIEIFGNDGQLYMPVVVTSVAGNLPVGLVASGSGAQLTSMALYNLGSTWAAAGEW